MSGDVVAMLLIVAAPGPRIMAQQIFPAASTPQVTPRYEVLASVVATALASEGLNVAPDRLHLPMPLRATTPTPQLHVKGAELQHDGSLQLRVVCQNAAECLPFFALVAMSDRAAAVGALAGIRSSAPAAPSPGAAALSPAAVAPRPQGIAVGAHVTLQLTDAQMRIQLPAVAIDTAAPGAEIRVASLDRKHTYRGTVVDAATVTGGLQ